MVELLRSALLLPSSALVRRELLRTLRRVRPLVFLVILLLIAIWIVGESWPSQYANAQTVAWMSRDLLAVVITSLYVCAAILMPAYGATSVVVEHEQDTYDLLILTLIRPSGILFGKLLNTLGVFALFAFAVMPVAATVFLLVGLEWQLLVQLLAIVGATAVVCASAGVYCSVRRRGVVSAVLSSYVITAILLGVYLIPCVVLIELLRLYGMQQEFEEFAIIVSSPVTVTYAASGDLTFVQLAKALAVQGFFVLVLLGKAWLWIRKPRASYLQGAPAPSLFDRWRGDRSMRYKQQTRHGAIPDSANPVYMKEVRWGAVTGTRYFPWLFVGLPVLLCVLDVMGWLLLFFEVRASDLEMILPMGWAVMVMGLAGLVAPALLANALTKEYERENIDALRMTLVTPRQIIWGKARAGVVSALPLLAAFILSGWVIPMLAGGKAWLWSFVWTGIISAWTSVLLVLSLSIYGSMMTKRTPTAILLGYICSWTVLFGFYLLALFADMNMLTEHGTDMYYSCIAFCSPMIAFFDNLQQFDFFSGRNWFRIMSQNPHFLYTWYWLANVIAHLLFCVFLLSVCSRAFRVSRMQDR
ncbi:MAG: ABC transporter permease subunit [Candidatus Hydrogenedentes bacterium]|nr:ABC transporter permease subunit [Candidatus Hydrogenedentota bacterium]